jgi:hypothetical protein
LKVIVWWAEVAVHRIEANALAERFPRALKATVLDG